MGGCTLTPSAPRSPQWQVQFDCFPVESGRQVLVSLRTVPDQGLAISRSHLVAVEPPGEAGKELGVPRWGRHRLTPPAPYLCPPRARFHPRLGPRGAHHRGGCARGPCPDGAAVPPAGTGVRGAAPALPPAGNGWRGHAPWGSPRSRPARATSIPAGPGAGGPPRLAAVPVPGALPVHRGVSLLHGQLGALCVPVRRGDTGGGDAARPHCSAPLPRPPTRSATACAASAAPSRSSRMPVSARGDPGPIKGDTKPPCLPPY